MSGGGKKLQVKMQQPGSAPAPPTPPDSAGILIGAAGSAAFERRNKTIMNCLRDRTPGYVRSHSRPPMRPEATTGRPDAVVLVRELRTHPNRLTLLKSTSTRDISRLVPAERSSQPLDVFATNSTTSSSASSNCHNQHNINNSRVHMRNRNNNHRNGRTGWDETRFIDLEQRVAQLEDDLLEERSYSRELESQLGALSLRVEEALAPKQPEKRKKRPSVRKRDSDAGSGGAGVQTSKLVAWMNLSNWWKHRPSIETLKQQNIYNDEPCFDTDIELVLKHDGHKNVPRIVVDCCDLIEEKYRKSSLPIEGIYRQCGDYNKIQTLRFRIDSNDYEALRGPKIDIHTLTGVLKLFLREIKSPLISTNEAKTFIGKPNQWLLTELPEKINMLKRLIRSLPEVNRDTMEYLFAHFNKLTKVPLQHVSAETLSLSVTPSVFHTVQQGARMQDIHVLLKESEILSDCVNIMIEYQSRIFECTAERRKRRISVRKLRKTLSHPDLLFQNLF